MKLANKPPVSTGTLRGSSVGRTSDFGSEGRRFDPDPRNNITSQ